MKRPNTSSLKQSCWTAALVLSLVFAQFAGLQHRIEHARWQSDSGFSLLYFGSDQNQKNSTHSCAVVDAATLADAVNATPCILVLATDTHALARKPIPSSWNAPVVHHFLSRAPPQAVL